MGSVLVVQLAVTSFVDEKIAKPLPIPMRDTWTLTSNAGSRAGVAVNDE
jgi:hypothetical protein